MRSSQHLILVLATILGLVLSNPARNARQLEEGSGDDSVDNIVTENEVGAPEDESEVSVNQDSENEISHSENLHESENEVKVDGPTEDEKLVEAEKKDNEKCKKCVKPSWRGRHASICESCEMKGVIKPIDKKDEKQIEKCKKCARRKFKARHGIFCSECPVPDLYEEEKKDNSENKKHKKNASNKLIKSVHENEEEHKKEKDVEIIEEESIDKKKNKNKNKTKKQSDTDKSNKKEKEEHKEKVKNKDQVKNKNHKNKNHKEKNKKTKNKNKKQTIPKPNQTKKASFGTRFTPTFIEVKDKVKPAEPAKANLGPLGSLIKYLVESNTFTK